MGQRKQDLRYMKTEKAIRKAFHELLQEKDLKRITVRELAERAEINKTTFYAHYETLPDLLDTLEMENINYIIDNLDQVYLLFEDSDVFIDNLYRNLQDCKISGISKNVTGSQQFISRLKTAIRKDLQARKIDIDKYDDVSTLLVFILHELLGMVNMETHCEADIERIKIFVKKGLAKE